MNKPEGITQRTDISGICDLCNSKMQASGGVVTASAMRLLVEGGFTPWTLNEIWNTMSKAIEKQGVNANTMIRRKYILEEFGDFGVCPQCYKKVCDFCV